MADEEIANLRIRMAEAAEADIQARQSVPPKPAMHKLRLLPEVTALLNRNSRDVESAIVDPENNLLESVRFFLEPLSDGSLPAYNIQRELFASLAKLPIDKEALISSGIGKVVLFYTKSKKPELGIKRAAERLMGEWTRPILKRSDDYRKRQLETADYDPLLRPRVAVPTSATQTNAEAIARALEKPQISNRARVEIDRKTYTIVPRSGQVSGGMFARPLGASGEDAFRRMKARQAAAQGKAPRRG
jgi:transcription factor SPN1